MDDDTAARLVECGLPRSQARAVAALARAGELPTPALERASGVRQSDLSVALTRLKARGVVAWRAEKGEGRGRPTNLVRLAVPFADVLDGLAMDGAPPQVIQALRSLVRSGEVREEREG